MYNGKFKNSQHLQMPKKGVSYTNPMSTRRQPMSRIKVYDTISIARVCELIPFSTRQKVEHVLIDASRNFDLQARVDHRSESVSFGQDLSGAHREAFPADDSPVYQVPSVSLKK